MNKMLTLASMALLALMTGCAAVNTNDAAVATEVVVCKTYAPKMDVKKEAVTGVATVNCLFGGLITWGVSNYADDAFIKTGSPVALVANPMTVAKQGATYNACAAADATHLLGATYRVDTEDYIVFKKVKCTATGYPGKVTGIVETKPVTTKTTTTKATK